MTPENYGIKISLPGYDVTTATPEQCAVHSGFDTLKVKNKATPEHFGVVKLSFASTPGSTRNLYAIAHNYSYRPASMAHWSDSSRAINPYSVTGLYPLNANFDQFLVAYTTDKEFRIDYVNASSVSPTDISGRVYMIRYYIFANDGN